MRTLQDIHSDFCALQQHKADVDDRYAQKFRELQEQILDLEKRWRESNAELVDEWHTIGNEFAACERALRVAIVNAYQQTGQKNLGDGLSVQVRSKLEYDEAAAIAWAETNAPICIKQVLDAKVFESMCKASKPDFVTVKEAPVAVIKETGK